MSTVRFSEDHEWIAIDGDIGTVGITDHAQEQLGDIVFVEVPESGRVVAKGEECAVVESVKAASEIYSPVAGEIIEGNATLVDAPETANSDPAGAGWFFKIKLSDPSDLDALMDESDYNTFVGS
ncbi:MAG: glycine cleavage system protein GcvH [Rhodospirillaceae bacterium]